MGADGWTGMQQLIVATRDFANAPKTAKQWSETVQKRMMTTGSQGPHKRLQRLSREGGRGEVRLLL